MPPKKEVNLLWVFGGLAGVIILFLTITDAPLSLFAGGYEKPKPGTVFELTGDNLAQVKRDVPVLVALYTGGSMSGTRMARGLSSLARDYQASAIVAVGHVDKEPELRMRASLTDLPAYVIYQDGKEVTRATGDDADISIRELVAEKAGRR